MRVTLCDMCPTEGDLIPAKFRVIFQYINNTTADQSIDLCQWHYDNLNIWKEKLS